MITASCGCKVKNTKIVHLSARVSEASHSISPEALRSDCVLSISRKRRKGEEERDMKNNIQFQPQNERTVGYISSLHIYSDLRVSGYL